MAVEIGREVSFGAGSKGFRFETRRNKKKDRAVYKVGQYLEAARYKKGSLGQRIFDRLSQIETGVRISKSTTLP